MKNKLQIISTIFFLACVNISSIYAQSLSIIDAETNVSGKIYAAVKSHYHVKNVLDVPVSVKVIATPITLGVGHQIQICTPLNCYSPTVDEFLSEPFTVAANEIFGGLGSYVALVTDADDDFDGNPDGQVGTSVINVQFVNSQVETDLVEYTVTFIISEDGSVSESWVRNSEVFPNPTSHFATVRLSEAITANSTMILYNSSGLVISTEELSVGTNTVEIDSHNMNSGTYYFVINSNGTIVNSGSLNVVK